MPPDLTHLKQVPDEPVNILTNVLTYNTICATFFIYSLSNSNIQRDLMTKAANMLPSLHWNFILNQVPTGILFYPSQRSLTTRLNRFQKVNGFEYLTALSSFSNSVSEQNTLDMLIMFCFLILKRTKGTPWTCPG